jgi:four helix bundle protein
VEASQHRKATKHEDLEVYRDALDLQQTVFQLSKDWPKEEKYALTDQVRRSSRSIGANLSEAWAKRRYQAHFTSKLTDADGELAESRHWLNTARLCGYLDEETHDRLIQAAHVIGRRIGNMIRNSDKWVSKAPPLDNTAE